jgi:hypothetical protein
MSRIKSIFAALLLAVIVGIVPQVHAQTIKVVLAGSSALWQTLALGAYNNGTSIVTGGGNTSHYTSGANFNLVDNRPTTAKVDNGATWIVWDSAPTPNVWAFVKVDSVVGNRCYFAAPKCTLVTNGAFPAVGNAIKVWPDNSSDTVPPANIQSLFTSGTFVSVAATDIRPEDAAFATCRVNSALGASVAGNVGGHSDNLDGLGYNTNNPAGQCPVHTTNVATNNANGVGKSIVSGFPGHAATDVANVLAFNLTGVDPITGTKLAAAYTVTPVGAAPIVFITAKTSSLASVHSATEQQLQQVFSGANCDASAFGSGFSGNLNVFLREPLSGTYNTAEATVFRYPTLYPDADVEGISQEKSVGSNNPLSNTCAGGGGARFRAIGTGEEVNSVLNSTAAGKYPAAQDGIGYTFFSYGNVAPIANNPNFGYIALNGIDPIFASYGAGQTIDPGQPSGEGVLPAQANLPSAKCLNSFPCSENLIWGNGFSFPNLRNGTYRAWSLLRVVSTGVPSTNAVALIKASQKYVVGNTPDYIPATAVTGVLPTGGGTAILELGLKLVRSHYQQKDGDSVLLGKAPTNVPEAGGDMGGLVIPTTIGVTTEKQLSMVQSSSAGGDLGPAKRP